MNKEEKATQIKESKDKTEGVPLTEEEEYIVMIGKGIKYVTIGGMDLIIPQLSIYEYDRMYEIDKAAKDGKNTKEIIDIKIKIFAEITKTKEEQWHEKGMVDFGDIENIHDIINYVFVKRKIAFEKKTINRKDVIVYSTLKGT